MKDFGTRTGSVSAGTDKPAHEGDTPKSCCTDNAPRGELVDKGPGPGIGSNGKRIG